MPALLCDLDGTLVDTTYLHATTWWQALAEHGHSVPMTDIHAAIGMGADQLLPHLLGDDPEPQLADELKARHAILMEPYWPVLQPTPGAADLLRAVAQAGIRVVLASSASSGELAALRSAIGADDAIAAATTGDDVHTTKPAPDIVQQALRLAGSTPEDSVMLGDTVWDIEAATHAGVPCIALSCGGTASNVLHRAGAVAVYTNPAALLANLDHDPVRMYR
jgi:HAD superfamily hydrolase (TIGR01509 family)